MKPVEILERLIGFRTVSRRSNIKMMSYISGLLRSHQIDSQLVYSPDGERVNLFATVGPLERPGLMLSGHSDVVPVDGQNWTVPPFSMSEKNGRLYGRGTADMKGFVACSIAAAIKASKMRLAVPLHLAFSYDEEIGCIGVRRLIDSLRTSGHRPLLCIVGEPTQMEVAIGHKGKLSAQAACHGREDHSAFAPRTVNAIHLACDFIGALRQEQDRLLRQGMRDDDYDIPYSTLHVGKIEGGVALNIVPNFCRLDFEIRNVAEENPEVIVAALRKEAAAIASQASAIAPGAAIDISILNSYPGLKMSADAPEVRFVKSLVGANTTTKVAFGTEGGLFNRDLEVPTVICGPGSMAQGHKPDEYISLDQLGRCEVMLDKLLQKLQGVAPIQQIASQRVHQVIQSDA